MPAFTQLEGIPPLPALGRTQSLPDAAMQLRAIGTPVSFVVHGSPCRTIDQILAQLRGAGVVLARMPAAGRVPGFDGTLLRFFAGADSAAVRTRAFLIVDRARIPHAAVPGGTLTSGTDSQTIALLLPAVQKVRDAGRRSFEYRQRAGPNFRGGMRVAVGDLDSEGDGQLWMLARGATVAGGDGAYVLTSVQHR